jgi:DNA invertase Pin-like site-specific DNA recombinase
LDRLARSLRQLLEIAEQCQSPELDLVSQQQNIDTPLPAGRPLPDSEFCEFEEMLRERVKAGMAHRRMGKKGRPALRCFNLSDVERLRALRSGGTNSQTGEVLDNAVDGAS